MLDDYVEGNADGDKDASVTESVRRRLEAMRIAVDRLLECARGER